MSFMNNSLVFDEIIVVFRVSLESLMVIKGNFHFLCYSKLIYLVVSMMDSLIYVCFSTMVLNYTLGHYSVNVSFSSGTSQE